MATPNGSSGTATLRSLVPQDIYSGVNVQAGAGYTVLATDQGKLITFSNAAVQTILLPATVPTAGWWVEIENNGNVVAAVSPNGHNLDGATTSVSLGADQGVRIVTDGTNYFTLRGVVFSAGTITLNGGSTDAINIGGIGAGVVEFWPLSAVTAHFTTAAAVTPKTLQVNGTLSSVAVTTNGTSGTRTWVYTLLKNGSSIGTCTTDGTATCTITPSPNTFVAGDVVVMQAGQSAGATGDNFTATWTSTYTYGISPIQ